MNTALETVNTGMTLWEEPKTLNEVRKLYASKLTDVEFYMFCEMGKSLQLNPFKKEIWAVKYGTGAAQIFIGINGYIAASHRNPDYEYHRSDAVWTNDSFEVIDGQIKHSFTPGDRGKLVGAYCIVKRRSSAMPVYTYVEFDEYSTGQSLWKSASEKGKPATMIKKVAAAQALRASFPNELNGTYIPEEMPQEKDMGCIAPDNIRNIKGDTQTERLKNLLDAHVKNITEEEIIEKKSTPLINKEKLLILSAMMDELSFTDERRKKALKHYKIREFCELTASQAEDFYTKLERIK